jgi:hypothetical protein
VGAVYGLSEIDSKADSNQPAAPARDCFAGAAGWQLHLLPTEIRGLLLDLVEQILPDIENIAG